MQAKYKKNVVDIVLCNVFAPQKPVINIVNITDRAASFDNFRHWLIDADNRLIESVSK